MKKITIFLFASFLFSIGTMAQITFKPHFGFNWSQLSSEPQDFSQEGRPGLQLGVGLRIGDRFYIEPAAQWAFIATDLVHTDDASNDIESSVNLFRIPVMFGYDFMEKDNFVNVRVFTGPSAAFVLSTSGTNAPDKDNYASTIWGWDVGAGVDIWFVYLELSYEFGLSSVFDAQGYPDANNNAFIITLGANLF